jgi:uncharacterized protein YcfJ
MPMNKQMIIGLCVGGLVATAGGAFALWDSPPKLAEIVSVKPITAAMEQQFAEVTRVVEVAEPGAPRFIQVVDAKPLTEPGPQQEVCESVVVTHQAPVKDQHQIAGTATGAVVGGVLGNQVGGGNGKKAATVAGAVVGGIIGKKVQESHQAKQTYQTTERQCHWEQGPERILGYDVTYEIEGESSLIFMDHKPGKQLPLVNGKIVTDKAEIKRLTANKTPSSYEVFYTSGVGNGSVIVKEAPKQGARLFIDDGEVVTDPQREAALRAAQQDVVAYQVTYRLKDELGQVRMTEKPADDTILIKNGKVIASSGNSNKAL